MLTILCCKWFVYSNVKSSKLRATWNRAGGLRRTAVRQKYSAVNECKVDSTLYITKIKISVTMFTCCTSAACCKESLFMLATGKMARKVVFVYAHVSTDVALERMFIAMTAHVNGVEDIVGKVNITVLAFM